MRTYLAALVALILGFTAVAAAAQSRDAVQAYIFGNSLVHHATDDPQTSVPHWLNELATADGTFFAVDGQWGFLRNFAHELPPRPNWSFPGVKTVWNSRRSRFSDAGFDTVMVNPANFIQYQDPDARYEGDNPTGDSALSATLTLFDWVHRELPEARLFIYEGWSDMATITSYPPSNRGLRRYHRFNTGDYHDWYVEYAAMVRDARPDMSVQLIPVASILSTILTSDPLSDIPATALYSDDAPHGTPSLYFLAAMITYAAFYEKEPPAQITLPEDVHPIIRDNYPAIAQTVWTLIQPTLQSAATQSAAPVQPVTQQAAAPVATPAPTPAPARDTVPGLATDHVPQLAIGLDGISDWSTQHPFVNIMKTARPWIGHLNGQFGGVDVAQLRAGGHLTAEGWPVSLPAGVTKLETVLMTDHPEDNTYLSGRWLMRWKGAGSFTVTGRATNVALGDGQGSFDFTPGDGPVVIGISDPNPTDPLRDVVIFKEEHLPLYEAGVIFNPVWVDRIKDMRSLRFMDWMLTNGSPVKTWDARPQASDYSYAERGVPLEVMLALANQVGADPWMNMPHEADDDYVRQFARLVRDGLDPSLKAYVEYSNEMWNFIFPQTAYAGQQAATLWGNKDMGWVEFYGYRAAQVMQIWSEEFGAQSDRLVRVVGVQTGWPGLEEPILTGSNATAALGAQPATFFDAYAVTGYFGHEIGGEEFLPQLQGWIDAGEDAASRAGEAQGLKNIMLRDYIAPRRFDVATERVTQALRDGAVRELTEEFFPYHAEVAQSFGLQMIMYEGGTHVTGLGDAVNDDRLTDFFTSYNFSPDMSALYDTVLQRWTDQGGRLFNGFVDVAKPSKWGSWGNLRHLNDSTGRWDALMRYNVADSGPDWQGRQAADFAHGVHLTADAGGDTLTGTGKVDILLGGPGDDTLVSNGGNDHLHGGAGYDIAELPGAFADYQMSLTEMGMRLDGTSDTVHLAGVEALGFADGIFIEVTALVR